MEKLTVEKYGELFIKYNDGEYRSPCLGCDSINKCNLEATPLRCGLYKALEKLKKYEDLEEQGKLLIMAFEICVVSECTHCNYVQRRIEETWIRPELLNHDGFYETREEAEAALKELEGI